MSDLDYPGFDERFFPGLREMSRKKKEKNVNILMMSQNHENLIWKIQQQNISEIIFFEFSKLNFHDFLFWEMHILLGIRNHMSRTSELLMALGLSCFVVHSTLCR